MPHFRFFAQIKARTSTIAREPSIILSGTMIFLVKYYKMNYIEL